MTGHFSGHSSRPLGAIAVDQQESQLSRGTCGNSCQDMLKYVKLFERLLTLSHSASSLPAVCQHSVSAWSFWHFGSCCYNLVLRRVSKVVALPDRLLQYSRSCYQLQAREIGIFEILRISEFYRNCYRDSAAYCGDRCRNLLGVRARVQSSRTCDH